MTDNEIIKALEWCELFENNIVFKGSGDEKCIQALKMMVVIKHALRNYHSQKAEIERLERHTKMHYEIIAEAIKEFAERLKGAKKYSVERHENIVPVAVIDWIVQEMAGDNNG